MLAVAYSPGTPPEAHGAAVQVGSISGLSGDEPTTAPESSTIHMPTSRRAVPVPAALVILTVVVQLPAAKEVPPEPSTTQPLPSKDGLATLAKSPLVAEVVSALPGAYS